MRDSSTKSFQQSYSCQAAVDDQAQVIVATHVTQEANDKGQVEPMAKQVQKNTGKRPGEVSADAGCSSEHNVRYSTAAGIDPYVATKQRKHSDKSTPAPRGPIPQDATVTERMERKLRTKKGRLRGLEPVRAEWRLLCLGHNLLKLFRSRALCAVT